MKTNEEFLDGIYDKHSALLKKRKKRISAIATTVCAAVCIVVAVGAFNSEEPNIVIELYNDIRKSGAVFTRPETDSMEKPSVEDAEGEVSTSAPEDDEHLTMAEIYTKPTKPSSENAKDNKTQQEQSAPKPEVMTVVAEDISAVDGEMGVAAEIPDSGGDSVSATQSLPAKKPMPSTEEIVEAAYGILPEEERQSIVKDNAVATVTRYADGTQIYEVTFTVTASLEGPDADHITVQLDSELNEIRTLHF